MNNVSPKPSEIDRIRPSQGSATILVVDDQPALCEVAELLLTRCGYDVITAHDFLQAKMAVRQNPHIDLLLTDVEMPGMLGDELAEWFWKTKPRAAVVFMSGNSLHRLRLREHPFIEKPFVHLDVLLKTIREALARNRTTCQSVAAIAA